jgi:ubiquinone/menaquinone biosynthesis C-methylase UbiE
MTKRHSAKKGESGPHDDTTDPIELTQQLNLYRLTRARIGIFPEGLDLSNVHDVLDLACGSGSWVHDVAYSHSHILVEGVDINQALIDHALAQARVQGLQNASFGVMDILQPLDFSDQSFDMVNARCFSEIVPTLYWPTLMRECIRILRPGGVLLLTDLNHVGSTNSAAGERLHNLLIEATQRAGRGFFISEEPTGNAHTFASLFQQTGYQDIQSKVYRVDFSVGTESHRYFYENLLAIFQATKALILQTRLIEEKEYNKLYQQAMIEMLLDDFEAHFQYVTTWGKKAS